MKLDQSNSAALPFRVNNFDLLRLFAALQVLLFHTGSRLDLPPGPQWAVIAAFPGVPIFFTISGFLISASLERSASIGDYARNRLYRIMPGLWLCVSLTLPAAALCGIDVFHWQTPVWLLAQMGGLIYTPGFLKDFGIGSYNGSLWTIPVELQFYLLLPLLAIVLRRAAGRLASPNRLLVLVWLVSVAVAIASQHLAPPPIDGGPESAAGKLLRYSFVPHVYLFLTGVLIQRLGLWRSDWIRGKGLYWLGLYIAFESLIPVNPALQIVKLMLLGVVAIACAYTLPTLGHRLLRGNDISYGVYIYHGLIINLAVQFGLVSNYGVAAEVVVAALLVGWLSWVLVERPILARKPAGGARKQADDIQPTPIGSSLATDKASHLVP